MKDRSKLVTFVALLALVGAFAMVDGGFPEIHLFGDSLFWVLWGVLIFFMVRGGCCGRASVDETGEASES